LLSMSQKPSGLVAEPAKRPPTPAMAMGSSLKFLSDMYASFSELLTIGALVTSKFIAIYIFTSCKTVTRRN
jgi:hypothetical protein